LPPAWYSTLKSTPGAGTVWSSCRVSFGCAGQRQKYANGAGDPLFRAQDFAACSADEVLKVDLEVGVVECVGASANAVRVNTDNRAWRGSVLQAFSPSR
jgi:hypothetical protein